MTNAALKTIAALFALLSTFCIITLPLTLSHLSLDAYILRTTPIWDTKVSSALEIWGEVTDILLAVAGWVVAVKLWKLNRAGRWVAIALLVDILGLMTAQAVLRPNDSVLSVGVIAVAVLLAIGALVTPRANILFGSVAVAGPSRPS